MIDTNDNLTEYKRLKLGEVKRKYDEGEFGDEGTRLTVRSLLNKMTDCFNRKELY